MCETIEEKREKQAEIDAIEAKRKPLSECDVNECTELRTEVWEKFDRLNRAGRFNHAQQFKIMLKQIETQQSLILRKAAEEDAKRRQIAGDEKARLIAEAADKRKDKSEAESDDKPKTQSVSSRWTSGIGNLD